MKHVKNSAGRMPLAVRICIPLLLTLLCGVEGVENVHLTAPAADVAVGSTELPMLGTVTISELTEA